MEHPLNVELFIINLYVEFAKRLHHVEISKQRNGYLHRTIHFSYEQLMIEDFFLFHLTPYPLISLDQGFSNLGDIANRWPISTVRWAMSN